MTKEQQFNQEGRRINNAIDISAEKKGGYAFTGQVMASIKVDELDKLKRYNAILLSTMKEIAVGYERSTVIDDNVLCKYFIGKAQEAIRKVEPEPETTLNPLFQDIVNNFLNSHT